MVEYKSFNVRFKFPKNCVENCTKRYIDYTVKTLDEAKNIDIRKSGKIDFKQVPYYTRVISAENHKGECVVFSMNKVIITNN